MTQNKYRTVTGVVFGLIALLHLLRIFYGWEAVIGGWAVPMWFSWLALLFAGYLSYVGFKRSS